MKKSIALLAGILLASNVSANAEPGWFVGAGLQNNKLEGEFYDDFFMEKESFSETETGLYLRGGVLLPAGRAYGALAMADYDGADLLTLTGSYDYLHALSDAAFLYAGVTAGLARFSFEDFSDETSPLIGFQLGALFSVSENVSVDLGFFYSRVDVEIKEDYVFLGNPYTDTQSVDTLSGFRIGIDYLF